MAIYTTIMQKEFEMTHTLLLIRHAAPQIDPKQPASVWPLTEKGLQDATNLAKMIQPFAPQHIISSQEVKAEQTGQQIATALNIDFSTMPNLHEHERHSVGWIEDFSEFQNSIKRFFSEPDDCVFGDESLSQTVIRFGNAINQITSTHPNQSIAISTHGTVMTAFITHHNQMDGFTFWKSLKTPCFVVCSLPDYKFIRLVTLA